MARIVIVPGLAVRDYALPTARALRSHGHDVSLLAAPAWRSTRVDPRKYGEVLASDLDERAEHVDLLLGLSVGTQVAAVAAAAAPDRVARLMMISPIVDPVYRRPDRLISQWAAGDPDDEGPGWKASLPNWSRAGLLRIAAGFVAALRLPLEDVLPGVRSDITIIHNEHDSLGTEAWSRTLAAENGATFISMAGKPHSWPIDDEEAFAGMVDELLRTD